MAENKRKFFSRKFLTALAVYLLILLAAVGIGLFWFYRFMAAYEETRPKTAAENYIAQLNADYILRRCPEFFDGLDTRVQSREESVQRVWSAIENMTFARQYTAGDGLTYVLKSGNQAFCTVDFARSDEKVMGFSRWEVSRESFNFDWLLRRTELTVPRDYTVSCGGVALDKSYVNQDNIEYDLLREFYDDFDNLPTMTSYRTGNYVGELELQVLDGDGAPVDAADLSQARFADNCSAEEKARIKDFVDEYINSYVSFLSSSRGGAANYERLSHLTVPDSDLISRISQAVGGLGFSHSHDSIQSIALNEVMNVGGGRYVCSVTYLVETLGRRDYVTTTNNTKLVIFSTDSGLRAAAQALY